jgi:Flp pilus assembly protein TadB
MSHPFLWLAGLYTLDKLNRQSMKIKEQAKRLNELEAVQHSGEAVDAVTTTGRGVEAETDFAECAVDAEGAVTTVGYDTQKEAGGCLSALFCLFIILPLCIAVILVLFWLLLFTTVGHILLVLFGVLLLLAMFGKMKG